MTDLTNQNQWVNDLKEALAKGLCYTVISVACFGAAASSFLAIPGLLDRLAIELPNYVLNTIYSIAIVNGVTFTVSQFWDGLLESTRVNLFGLPPSHDKELQENLSIDEEIEDLRLEIINKIEILEEMGVNIKNTPKLKAILNHAHHYIQFDDHIARDLNLANQENSRTFDEEQNNLLTFFLFLSNKLFAGMVLSTGILTSIILTILGTTKAIETLAPMLIGPAAFSGLTVTVMACLVAFGSQYCKSSTFGHKQWNLLMWFFPKKNSEEENLPPKEIVLKLQGNLIKINKIYIETQDPDSEQQPHRNTSSLKIKTS